VSLLLSDGLGASGSSSQPAPTLQNLTPASGTVIVPSTVIEFDVTDFETDGTTPVDFDLVFVKAVFPNIGEADVVYDEDGLGPMYQNPQTSVTDITGGYHFKLVRTGGWIDTQVDMVVSAINVTGAEL